MPDTEVHELVRAVAAIDDDCGDRDALTTALGQLRRLRSWCQSRGALFAKLLAETSSTPEDDLRQAGRTSARAAARQLDRAGTTQALPSLGSDLADGHVAGEHVDVLTRALRQLEAHEREALLARADQLRAAARTMSPDEFERWVADEVRRLRHHNGEDRLRQQQRDSRLRTWVDLHSGMWNLRGEFDPATGSMLAQRIKAMVETLFAEHTPDTCPTDPVEKQHHLRALALVAFTEGRGAGKSRPEVVVVVDTTQSDPVDGGPSIDWGLPVQVPRSVLDELLDAADVRTVATRNGVVFHAPGELNLGRSTRMANRAQRRAARALYATCGIPGCSVRYDNCKLHHVRWWRHGGPTDFDNLLPLCSRHHHCVHDRGWLLSLAADRTLTVHLPDGRTFVGHPNRRRAP